MPAGGGLNCLPAVRRLAGLDPGLVERLGLVVGRIGAGDRRALADADGDELLQPLLLEGIARHFVGKMARHDDGAVLVGHDHVAGIDRHAADADRRLHLDGMEVVHAGRRRGSRAIDRESRTCRSPACRAWRRRSARRPRRAPSAAAPGCRRSCPSACCLRCRSPARSPPASPRSPCAGPTADRWASAACRGPRGRECSAACRPGRPAASPWD